MLAIVIVAILGQSLQNVMIALAAVGWASYARLLRGDILAIKEREFVDGARALGARSGRLIFRHILPNSLTTLLIVGSKTRAPARALVDMLGTTLPNATVTVLNDAGHMSPFTHPSAVNRMIAGHLAAQHQQAPAVPQEA